MVLEKNHQDNIAEGGGRGKKKKKDNLACPPLTLWKRIRPAGTTAFSPRRVVLQSQGSMWAWALYPRLRVSRTRSSLFALARESRGLARREGRKPRTPGSGPWEWWGVQQPTLSPRYSFFQWKTETLDRLCPSSNSSFNPQLEGSKENITTFFLMSRVNSLTEGCLILGEFLSATTWFARKRDFHFQISFLS